MPTAIVTGATGMTGIAIVDALIKDSSYTSIYTLSRSQPSSVKDNPKVKHAHIDLQSSAQDMAKDLADVEGQHIFFCAYLAKDSEDEAAKVNSAMLQNFLDALIITGALPKVERIVLTCGLKQYGVHLGQTKQPMFETDSLLTDTSTWPPNFYYDQQRVLINNTTSSTGQSSNKQSKNPADQLFQDTDNLHAKGNYTWTVTFPQDILGYAPANFMNELTALALYATIGRETHQDKLLPFPGSLKNYMAFNCWTSSTLHAEFCVWAASAPNAANQVFNVTNGDTESWQNLWPRICARFGCAVPETMFPYHGRGSWWDFPPTGEQKLHKPAPISVHAKEIGMVGYEGEVSTLYQQIDTSKWSNDPKVKETWARLVKEHNLQEEALEKASWGFLTFVLGREYSCVVSMSKARKMGFHGYQDTWSSMESVFQRLEKEGIIPPIKDAKSDK